MPRLVSQSTLAASIRSTSARSISTSALPRASAVAARSVGQLPAKSVTFSKFAARSAAFSTSTRIMGGHAGVGKGEDNVRPPPTRFSRTLPTTSTTTRSTPRSPTTLLVSACSIRWDAPWRPSVSPPLPTSAVPSSPALWSPTVLVSSVPTTSSTPSVPLSTTALSSDGSTLTTPGSPPSGVTLRTTLAPSSRSLTGSAAPTLPMARSPSPSRMSSPLPSRPTRSRDASPSRTRSTVSVSTMSFWSRSLRLPSFPS